MKLKIVVVRDSAADVFGQPNFVTSIGGAVRGFGDEVNNPREGNALHKHPGDFLLFCLGEYDDATAKFNLLDMPEQIARAIDFVKD